MPLTQSSHIIGLLRGRDAGGHLVLPGGANEGMFLLNKKHFFPTKVLLFTLH